MKRILVFTLTFALMVSLFNFGFSYAAKASQKDLSNVNNEISNTQKKLNEGKSVEIKLNKDISSLENQINQTQNDINNLKGNIDATQAKINEALAQLAQVEAEMAIQNQQLSSRLRIMYKNGGVGVLDVILGSDSISDFMTNMIWYKGFTRVTKRFLKPWKPNMQSLQHRENIWLTCRHSWKLTGRRKQPSRMLSRPIKVRLQSKNQKCLKTIKLCRSR